MAYSPKPLYEFYETLYFLRPEDTGKAEAKVADWLARGIIVELADRLGGSVKSRGLQLIAQKEFLQRQQVIDWLQLVMKAEPNPDKLHTLIQNAVKYTFSQSYYTPDYQPAAMPAQLNPRNINGRRAFVFPVPLRQTPRALRADA